jgi:hypothetical protein
MLKSFTFAAGMVLGATQMANAQDIRFYFGDQFTAEPLRVLKSDSSALEGYHDKSGTFEVLSYSYHEPYRGIVLVIPKTLLEGPFDPEAEGLIFKNDGYQEGGACAFLVEQAGNVYVLPDRNHNYMRVIVELSGREIDRAVELNCLAVQRRSGQNRLTL